MLSCGILAIARWNNSLRTLLPDLIRFSLDTRIPTYLSRLKSLDEVVKAITYMTKMIVSGYRHDPRNGRKQGWGEMSLKQHLNLLLALSPYSLFDFWFSEGEGTSILRSVKTACVERKDFTTARCRQRR